MRSLKNYYTIFEESKKYNANLVVVTKNQSLENIQKVYNAGHRNFGENKVQELLLKREQMPDELKWHLIGSLQKNKVKSIIPFIHLIHSVDSFLLAEKIHQISFKASSKTLVLLEFKIGTENTKHGFSYDQFLHSLENDQWNSLSNITIVGVMGMASFTSDQTQIRKEFKNLHSIFENLKNNYFNYRDFKEISMGMSGDYQIALDEGSTIIRVGSKIFMD
jgi:PLP dependent protein